MGFYEVTFVFEMNGKHGSIKMGVAAIDGLKAASVAADIMKYSRPKIYYNWDLEKIITRKDGE